MPRPGSGIEEQVQSTVRYRDGVLVNFYHGFHQPGRLDRQELRLLFERGDITLFDWIPSRFHIRGLVDEAQTRELCELFPGARLDVTVETRGQAHGEAIFAALRGEGYQPIWIETAAAME